MEDSRIIEKINKRIEELELGLTEIKSRSYMLYSEEEAKLDIVKDKVELVIVFIKELKQLLNN